MSATTSTRPDRAVRYQTAEASADRHTATCPTCRGGCVCSTADDLYTAEYRTYAAWSDTDRTAARAYARTLEPSDG